MLVLNQCLRDPSARYLASARAIGWPVLASKYEKAGPVTRCRDWLVVSYDGFTE